MLLGNYNIFNANPGRCVGGVTDPTYWMKGGCITGWMYGESMINGETKKSSLYNGYLPPYNVGLPISAGSLSMAFGAEGTGSLSNANLAAGVNIESSILGSGTISDAALGLIMSAVATLTGSGLFSAEVAGKLEAVASLAGTGDVTGSLGALAGLVAEITSTGSAGGLLEAKGNMSAEITPFTTLSPENLAAKVWTALADQFTDPSTMGGKLNLASSGGVDYGSLANAVWESLSSEHQNPSTLGGIISELQTKLDELHKIQGLDPETPLTITPDIRTAGSIDLEITGDKKTLTVVTRQ